jgi:hypothetical protein
MLNVRVEKNRRYQTLSFVEAVCQDSTPTLEELLPAYRVAGDSFLGRMREIFIILDDDEAKRQPAKAAALKKKQKKRQASGEGPSDLKLKTMPSTQ